MGKVINFDGSLKGVLLHWDPQICFLLLSLQTNPRWGIPNKRHPFWFPCQAKENGTLNTTHTDTPTHRGEAAGPLPAAAKLNRDDRAVEVRGAWNPTASLGEVSPFENLAAFLWFP